MFGFFVFADALLCFVSELQPAAITATTTAITANVLLRIGRGSRRYAAIHERPVSP